MRTVWRIMLLSAGLAVGLSLGTTAASAAFRLVPVPESETLTGVAAIARWNAWAVSDLGLYHYNGRWSERIGVGGATPSLADVSFDSATSGWAVGQGSSGGAFAARWNGTTWNAVATPAVTGSVEVELSGVVSLSASNAWAVGTVSFEQSSRPIVEHWNGASWKISATPQFPAGASLVAVSARTASNVWAVGSYTATQTSPTRPIALSWNGTAWRITYPSAPKGTDAHLDDVVVLRASNVWAVGETPAKGLVDHWIGTGWTWARPPVPTCSTSGHRYDLRSVSAFSASNLWAFGRCDSATLALHNTGSGWSRVATPSVTGQDVSNDLLGSSTIPGTSLLWAVGDSVQGPEMPSITSLSMLGP